MHFVENSYFNKQTGVERKFHTVEFEAGTSDQAMLAELAHWLSQAQQDEQHYVLVRETASELAEDCEIPFVFTDVDGKHQEYTPRSMWEASSSCSEWEQSAEYGYDYGWNI